MASGLDTGGEQMRRILFLFFLCVEQIDEMTSSQKGVTASTPRPANPPPASSIKFKRKKILIEEEEEKMDGCASGFCDIFLSVARGGKEQSCPGHTIREAVRVDLRLLFIHMSTLLDLLLRLSP